MRRDNHFVPQFYLRRWTGLDGKLHAYRLLVSHDSVPLWKPASPRGIAFHRHLYTRIVAGHETDEFERWLDREFESPAEPILAKLEAGRRLTRNDRVVLARFAAAQDVRTPSRYVENRERWIKTLPGLMNDVIARSTNEFKKLGGRPYTPIHKPPFDEIPFRTVIEKDDSGQHYVKAEIVIGRKMWLASMRQVLTSAIKVLHGHHWTILIAPRGMEWPTSDDPVCRLNYRSDGDYNLEGGWGTRGSEILFPLTPRHLLYTRIGYKPASAGAIPPDRARKIRSVLARRAHRLIVASSPDSQLVKMRPRTVDAVMFKAEQQAWLKFASEQASSEKDLEGYSPDIGGLT